MKPYIFAVFVLVLTQMVVFGDTPESGSAENDIPSEKWGFTPDPALPDVLILGDSISIGYTLQVRKRLEGKANVFRPMQKKSNKRGKVASENCGGSTKGVERIDEWLKGREWTVIHFNFGLHDLKHVDEPGSSSNSTDPNDPFQATVEQYSQNMEVIVSKLKATGARLVFATTTPVAPDTEGVAREPESPPLYNAAAVEIMQENGIRVNDLHEYCLPNLKNWQLPRNVHFKPQGSKALAAKVASVIGEELESAKAE